MLLFLLKRTELARNSIGTLTGKNICCKMPRGSTGPSSCLWRGLRRKISWMTSGVMSLTSPTSWAIRLKMVVDMRSIFRAVTTTPSTVSTAGGIINQTRRFLLRKVETSSTGSSAKHSFCCPAQVPVQRSGVVVWGWVQTHGRLECRAANLQ